MNYSKCAHELVEKMSIDEKISQISHISDRIERLNIPAFNWWSECCHGSVWSGDATVFTQAIGMAASFDKELIKEVAEAIADEIRAKYNEFRSENGDVYCFEGVSVCTPNINIFRDPRWGRGQETFGEDPYLTGVMASQFINGLQGKGKYIKVAAVLKHFAAHSGPDGERHSFSANVSDKDLYETYFSAFKYCIEHCNIQTVMTAYNAINGVPCCVNNDLLNNILRKEFGFDGFVETDHMSLEDLCNGFKLCDTADEGAAMALNAGCDLDIGVGFGNLKKAYEKGLVTKDRITEACERVMKTRFALGCFDDECEFNEIDYDVVRCDKHKKLSLKMAQDSIVLLKNDGILPLKGYDSIAVIGPVSNDGSAMFGNFSAVSSEYITFYEGIKKATNAKVYWAHGCRLNNDDINTWSENFYRSAVMAAKRSDIVILFMGLSGAMEGEECDKQNIDFPESQKRLFQLISALKKPTVFVNVSGSCMNLSEQDEKCNAVIQCFYPGEMGGEALADILFGKVNPSGRLPVTFYASSNDLPPVHDYSMENRTYKYFRGKPLYPFGHGLSFTKFEYHNIKKGRKEVTLDVKNIGDRNGAHSVLIYGKRDVYALAGFEKVFLEAGECVTITILLNEEYEFMRIGEELYI